MVGTQTHLHPTNLRLAPDTISVLLGPTQTGKTTLMRIMVGLDQPTTDRILVGSEDVTGVRVCNHDLAIMYQQFINYPVMTVHDNIASSLRLQGTNRGEIDTRVRAAVSRLHTDHLLQCLSAGLSGGQQQRCTLVRALVRRAPLALLDGPLADLSYKLREKLCAELTSLFVDSGTTVVYATTKSREVLLPGDHTVVMHEGRVLQDGLVLDMHEASVSVNAAAIFNDPPMNVLDAAMVEGNQVHLPQGIDIIWTRPLPTAAGTRYHIGPRPNHIRLTPRNDGVITLPDTVELMELSGSETYLYVRAHTAGQSNTIGLVAQLPGMHGLELGAALDVFVDPTKLFLFDDADKLVSASGQGGAYGTY